MTPPTSQPVMAMQRPPAVQDPVPGNVFFFNFKSENILLCFGGMASVCQYMYFN